MSRAAIDPLIPPDPQGWRPGSVAGVGRGDVVSAPFQFFVSFWYANKPDAGVPPLEVLARRDAPPVMANGIVFAVETGDDGAPDFRVHRAGEAFDFYYRRTVVGCRLGDLFDPTIVERRRARYTSILNGGTPDYARHRRSRVPGREIVWIERIYAPFADDTGAPAFVGGLVKLGFA